MSRLILVGASGLAREVLACVPTSTEVLVVDDDPARLGTAVGRAQVVGDVDSIADHRDAEVLVCVGKGTTRRGVVARLAALGVTEDRFARVVHPGVDVPSGCTVGAGSILLAGVVLTADVSIGRHVVAMPHVTLTHDDVVDDCATLCAGVTLGGGVRVGSGAYLGMNAAVREGVSVGRDAVLGMGSVLLEDLPQDETWVGSPARFLPKARPRRVSTA